MTIRQHLSPRRRRDRGETLIELLMAIVMLGGSAVVLVGGLAASTKTSSAAAARTSAAGDLSAFAAQASALPFTPCATTADYTAALSGLPADMTVTDVAQWDDVAQKYVAEADYTDASSDYVTTLSANISDTTTNIPLTDDLPSGVHFPLQIKVGSEYMTVVNTSGIGVRVVNRGAAGDPHASGSPVAVCPRLQRITLSVTRGGETQRISVAKRGTLAIPTLAVAPVACSPTPCTNSLAPTLASTDVTNPDFGKLTFAVTAALVGGEPAQTGTFTYDLYYDLDSAPANCSHKIYTVGPLSVSKPTSASTLTTQDAAVLSGAGTFRWVVSYSGDAVNQPARSACADLAAANHLAGSVLTGVAPPPVPVDQPSTYQVHLTAAAIGADDPDDILGFYLYKLDGSGHCAATPVQEFALTGSGLTAEGDYSHAFTPVEAGAYKWLAVYSGGAHDTPTSRDCNTAGRPLTVNKAAPAVVPTGTGGAGTVTANASLTGASVGTPPTGTVTFGLYASADCSGKAVTATQDGPVASSAAATTFASVPAGTYFVGGTYSGDDNNAPATAVACAADPVTVT